MDTKTLNITKEANDLFEQLNITKEANDLFEQWKNSEWKKDDDQVFEKLASYPGLIQSAICAQLVLLIVDWDTPASGALPNFIEQLEARL